MESPDPFAPTRHTPGTSALLWADLSPELRFVMAIAMAEARERGHAFVDAAHVLWVLAAWPECADPLRRGGVEPQDLATRCEDLLLRVSVRSDPPPLLPATRGVTRMLGGALSGGGTVSALLDQYLHPPWTARLRRAWRGYGTAETLLWWLRRSPVSLLWSLWRGPLSDGGPPPVPSGHAAIALLNDDRTSMDFVLQQCRTTFGASRFDAIRAMLATHARGSAVVGVWPRAEAEALAARVTEAAREAGFPLRLELRS